MDHIRIAHRWMVTGCCFFVVCIVGIAPECHLSIAPMEEWRWGGTRGYGCCRPWNPFNCIDDRLLLAKHIIPLAKINFPLSFALQAAGQSMFNRIDPEFKWHFWQSKHLSTHWLSSVVEPYGCWMDILCLVGKTALIDNCFWENARIQSMKTIKLIEDYFRLNGGDYQSLGSTRRKTSRTTVWLWRWHYWMNAIHSIRKCINNVQSVCSPFFCRLFFFGNNRSIQNHDKTTEKQTEMIQKRTKKFQRGKFHCDKTTRDISSEIHERRHSSLTANACSDQQKGGHCWWRLAENLLAFPLWRGLINRRSWGQRKTEQNISQVARFSLDFKVIQQSNLGIKQPSMQSVLSSQSLTP